MKRSGLSKFPFRITQRMKDYLDEAFVKVNEEKWTDQFFLRDILYPYTKNYTMTHDSWFCNGTKYDYLWSQISHGFPLRREGNILAACQWWPNGTAAVPENYPDTPVECRRRPEWTKG